MICDNCKLNNVNGCPLIMTDAHLYYNGDDEYKSVSEFIKGFMPEFNPNVIKVSQKEKDSWADKANLEASKGTFIHSAIERYLKYNELAYGLNSSFITILHKLKKDLCYGDIYMEQMMCNQEYKIAGTADLVVRRGKSDVYDLYDFKKRNKDRDNYKTYHNYKFFNRYMKKPIEYLEDTLFNKHMLQLNTYAYMLSKHHKIGTLGIIYININKEDEIKPFDIDIQYVSYNPLIIKKMLDDTVLDI